MTATTAVKNWVGLHRDTARTSAEESAKDEIDGLNAQIQEIEDEAENLAVVLHGQGLKMLEIMAQCEPIQARSADLKEQLKGVAPGEEDINALAIQYVIEDLADIFQQDSPYHLHIVIPAKPEEGKAREAVLCEVIDAPRTRTVGKSFLRITGSDVNYVGSFRECVTQLYEGHHACRIRYATREDAAEEKRTSDKTGNVTLVQKLGINMKVATMLADLFDPRMCAVPYTDENVVEIGRTKPDGSDSVEMTLKVVALDSVPDAIKASVPEAISWLHIQHNDKKDSSSWRPVGIRGLASDAWPSHLRDAYMNGGQVYKDLSSPAEQVEPAAEAKAETAEPVAAA